MTDRYLAGWRACRRVAALIAYNHSSRLNPTGTRIGNAIRDLPDPALAAEPDSATAPGHTDLMVRPEMLADFMEANPLPEPAAEPDARVVLAEVAAMRGETPETVLRRVAAIEAEPDARVAEIRKQLAAGYLRGEAGAAIAYLLAKLEGRR